MKFAEYLKNFRMEKNLSQRLLAEILAVSNTEISRIESGKRQKISPEFLIKFSTEFNIPMKNLMDIAGYNPALLSNSESLTYDSCEETFIYILSNYLDKLGWNVKTDNLTDSIILWDLLALNCNNKVWAIEFIFFDDYLFAKGYLLNKFCCRIGKILLDNRLDKFSIAVNNITAFNYFRTLNLDYAKTDISIILLNLANGHVEQEAHLHP